jgi:uncharacterized membrane protein SirB2
VADSEMEGNANLRAKAREAAWILGFSLALAVFCGITAHTFSKQRTRPQHTDFSLFFNTLCCGLFSLAKTGHQWIPN